MAKQKPADGPLGLEYRLADLPTPQHTAGLAGLLLVIEAMRRLKITPRPEVLDVTPGGAAVRLTRESLETLYDCFFQAREVQIGKKRKPRPHPMFLDALGMPEGWRALWANIIGQVTRAAAESKQMAPYRDRIPGSEKVPNDWAKVWEDLAKDVGTTISGSDLPGIEARTPEKIPMKASARSAFPLLFAPAVYRPGEVVAYAAPGRGRNKPKDYRVQSTSTFALAVPDVADLEWFVKEYPAILAALDDARIGNGIYPAAAQVMLPDEAGLDLLAAARVTAGRVTEDVNELASSVRVMHLAYGQGSVDLRHVADLAPDDALLEAYAAVRREAKHPMFRALQVRCLLEGRDWTEAAGELFAQYPHELFAYQTGASPPGRTFGQDVRDRFKIIRQNVWNSSRNRRHEAPPMTDPPAAAPAPLPDAIKITLYDLVRRYVDRRVEDRTGKTYTADFKGRGAEAKGSFREAREKVCKDAFLAIRGRHDVDFVDYFRGTLCAVPQRVGWDDFGPLADALVTRPGDVKTLTMLALSAHSYLYVKGEDDTDPDTDPDTPAPGDDDE